MIQRHSRISSLCNQGLSPSRGAAATTEEQLSHSYPGWQQDVLEQVQRSGGCEFAVAQRNIAMDGKQVRFERNMRALQDLQPLLSYPDWQHDYEQAQIMLFTTTPGFALHAKIREMKIKNDQWEQESFPLSCCYDGEGSNSSSRTVLSDTSSRSDLSTPEAVELIAKRVCALSTSRITLRRTSRVGGNLADLPTTPNSTDDSTVSIQSTSSGFARTNRRYLRKSDASQTVLAAPAPAPPSANFGDCVVCLDNRRQIAMVPCGHLCLCRVCAHQLQRDRSTSKCPICNVLVHSTMQIFLS